MYNRAGCLVENVSGTSDERALGGDEVWRRRMGNDRVNSTKNYGHENGSGTVILRAGWRQRRRGAALAPYSTTVHGEYPLGKALFGAQTLAHNSTFYKVLILFCLPPRLF